MTKPDPTSSQHLQEARSVGSSAERLHELYQADPALGPVIASNPSAPIELLDQLALQCPSEVLANPVLQLRALETCGAYRELSLQSLVCLCLACDPQRNADLLEEARRRIHAGIDELQMQDYATLECNWLFNRDFTLFPTDCNMLISEPVRLTITVLANVHSEGPITVTGLPNCRDMEPGLPGTATQSLAEFLQAISSGELRTYINDDELVREDGGVPDIDLRAEALPEGLLLDGTTLFRSAKQEDSEDEEEEDDEPILEFSYSYYGRCDSPIVYEGGVLTVPVEFVDEVNHHYHLAMGELGDLAGMESKCPSLPADWHIRLAALLIP